MRIFSQAQFETSVASPKNLPNNGLAEIAFAGRSNAGKSSAINTLLRQNRLAFVSKTPGRTQLINYFRLGCGAALVDLPGYGYAQVPVAVRKKWQELLAQYLTERANLIGLVIIMDVRRPLTILDQQMINWFAPIGRPIHILLSKSDKLSRGNAQATLLKTRQQISQYGSHLTVQLFSSLKNSGRDEAENRLTHWLEVAGFNLEEIPKNSV